MSPVAWIVIGIVALGLFGLYLSMTAGRLDRLHQRIDTAALALEAQLLRRSAVALEISTSGILDPAAALLVSSAAHEARTSLDLEPVARSAAESDLTAALEAALGDPDDLAAAAEYDGAEALLAELGAAGRRVQLARRFHNDAVQACRQVRSQRMVRWFRLAGHTELPRMWELDDALPPALTGEQGQRA